MKKIVLGDKPLSIDDLADIALSKAAVEISKDKEFIKKIGRSQETLNRALDNGVPVYGVTTGYGKSCDKRIPIEAARNNGTSLLRYHGCGTGKPIGIAETRAAIATRISCFARGYSGVSMELIEKLAEFLNKGITPIVPEEGSVGASGDLTPMSYIASALIAERDVFYKGQRMPAREAMKKANIEPYKFKPKEVLAIINGTSIMTGIAIMAIGRARRILNGVIRSTALTIHALMGNSHHFHPLIYRAMPHPGQESVAKNIEHLLQTGADLSELEANTLQTLQDPYSVRCSPQVLGVLHDSLEWITRWIEIEANSANDNPLLDVENDAVLMGGNFYGGHVASAMDSLKSALASVADLCDRQIVLLLDPNTSRGLPADLVIARDESSLLNHGFKAMSITASSLTAESLKLTMPAASFSRSTESHNQDVVSMGTIAARDAVRVCELVERVVAIHLLSATQACEIRGKVDLRPGLVDIITAIRKEVSPVREDRPMDGDIEEMVSLMGKSDFFNDANGEEES
jgi:histidine ammonia-lyase